MNPNIEVLQMMYAIAVYEKLGIIEGMKTLLLQGWTKEETIEIFALYDSYKDAIVRGLPI